jgi:hypothetical protein
MTLFFRFGRKKKSSFGILFKGVIYEKIRIYTTSFLGCHTSRSSASSPLPNVFRN